MRLVNYGHEPITSIGLSIYNREPNAGPPNCYPVAPRSWFGDNTLIMFARKF